MNEMISVIVPVYNTEKYLSRCVESIVNQTYKNLEIILVDDGSTDKSAQICDDWKNKDNRIVVIHKKNEGISSARNRGIEIAKGDYIGFIDSDDYIEKKMYEVLYQNFIKFHVDISMCNYYIVKDNKKTFHKHNLKDGLLIESNKPFLELLRLNYYKGFLWNKLFKTEVLKKVKLCEDIHMCEDLLLIVQLSEYCKRFYFDNKCYYNYVIRKNSAITGAIDKKKFTVLETYRKIINLLEKYGEEISIKYEYDFFKWENDLINQSGIKDEKLDKENKMLYKKVMRSKYIKFSEKIETFMRYKMYKIYCIIYDIIRKLYHKLLVS